MQSTLDRVTDSQESLDIGSEDEPVGSDLQQCDLDLQGLPEEHPVTHLEDQDDTSHFPDTAQGQPYSAEASTYQQQIEAQEQVTPEATHLTAGFLPQGNRTRLAIWPGLDGTNVCLLAFMLGSNPSAAGVPELLSDCACQDASSLHVCPPM